MEKNKLSKKEVVYTGTLHSIWTSEWVLVKENIGECLSIDETSLHDDLFTILPNKAGHGRKGTVVAMVRGTKAQDVVDILKKKGVPGNYGVVYQN